MNRSLGLVVVLTVLVVVWSGGRLTRRWAEERQDRQVALLTDWNEFRDLAARQGRLDSELLKDLQSHGVTALLITPVSLQDLLNQKRLRPAGPTLVDPLDTDRLQTADRPLALQIHRELWARGIQDMGVGLDSDPPTVIRRQGTFHPLKDIEVGFDPRIVAVARQFNVVPVFRLHYDAWLPWPEFMESLHRLESEMQPFGLLLGTDDVPGGLEALPQWRNWLLQTPAVLPLFEFHPPFGSWLLAKAVPSRTYRAHTIPVLEMKDLDADRQLQRWMRAVEERSCRFLWVHVAPTQSAQDYLNQLDTLRAALTRAHFTLGFPQPRQSWVHAQGFKNLFLPWMALALAIVTPVAALLSSQKNIMRQSFAPLRNLPIWFRQFMKLSVVTLLGALLVAALADTPALRVGIVTFRGIKICVLASWILSLGVLYSWKETRAFLTGDLKRWEVLAGLISVGVIGYLLLRSGNVSAEWKPSWEQPVREALERLLVARPRFKEFVIGHPLLLLGFFFQRVRLPRVSMNTAKAVIAAGMIGPISVVNTFCHLHSPLCLELLRTFNGLWLGTLLGFAMISLVRRYET